MKAPEVKLVHKVLLVRRVNKALKVFKDIRDLLETKAIKVLRALLVQQE